MAYDYLSLVNEVNRRLNEVELTSSNFSSATGFYAHNKDAVNAAIRDINHVHYQWPFNHVLAEDTLVAGTVRYSYPADANAIDFDTFRIKEDAVLGNTTQKLKPIVYEDYLNRYVDQEYSTSTSIREVPKFVFQTPSLQYGVVSPPDKAYTLYYEYYKFPLDLDLYTDVPTIPERFRHVIVDGAMYYAYMFRSNEQAATLAKSKFDEGVKRMRTLLVNRYEYMRSSQLISAKASAFGDRVN